MYPILFGWGPLTIYTYGALLALGALMGLWLLRRLARREGLDPEKTVNLMVWVLVAGVAGSRVAYVLGDLNSFLLHPWRALAIWHGGLFFYGGLIVGFPLALILGRVWKIPFWPLADSVAPALALGQAIGRLGCFSAGCCFGQAFDGPWGVVFTHHRTLAPPGVALHPTQLYTAGALFIITAVLLVMRPRKDFNGQIFLLYGLLHGIARLVIEQFRADWRGAPILDGVTPTMAVAAVLAATCLAGLIIGMIHKGMNRPEMQGRT